MNQTFSLPRFGLLLRTYLSDNRGILLISFALLVGGLSVIALFFYNSYPDDVERSRYILFYLVGWVAWYAFTVQQVTLLNDKERAISYLLRPASLLEKCLLIVLISGIGFLIVYPLVFALIDAVGTSYINNRNWMPDQLARIRSFGGRLYIAPFYQSDAFNDRPAAVSVFSVLLHPVALSFALLIRRFTLPLVAVVVMGLVIVGLVGNEYLINKIVASAQVVKALPFANPVVMRNNMLREIRLPEPIGTQIGYSVGILAVLLLYVTAYFRLKEREV